SRFATMAPGGPEPALAPPPARRARERVSEARPTEQTHLLVGYLAPPIVHPDYAPLRVLNALLGSGMSSRLFHALREEAGLAYAVGSFFPTRREVSRIVVHIGTAPANARAAEQGMLREVGRLRDQAVGEEELARTKTYLTGSFDLDLRTNAHQS